MTATRWLAILCSIAALYFGSAVIIPIICGFFLFLLLDPLVVRAEKKGINRALSSIVLVGVSVLLSCLIAWGLYGAFADIAKDLPHYSDKLKSLASGIEKRAERLEKNTDAALSKAAPLEDDIQKVQVVEGYGRVTGFALKGLGTIFDAMASAFFIPLLALFFLLDKFHLGETVNTILARYFNVGRAQIETSKMVKSFFIGNLVIGFGMAILLTLLYSILGLKNSVAFGLATGFLNLIPFLGPIVSLVLPMTQALLQFSTPAPFIIIATAVVVLHFAVANIVVPKVVGSHVNVNVLAATIGLMFWGWIWGAVGLLLAVPLTAIIKIVLENHPQTREWSLLFSDRPKPHPHSVLRKFLTQRFEKVKSE